MTRVSSRASEQDLEGNEVRSKNGKTSFPEKETWKNIAEHELLCSGRCLSGKSRASLSAKRLIASANESSCYMCSMPRLLVYCNSPDMIWVDVATVQMIFSPVVFVVSFGAKQPQKL